MARALLKSEQMKMILVGGLLAAFVVSGCKVEEKTENRAQPVPLVPLVHPVQLVHKVQQVPSVLPVHKVHQGHCYQPRLMMADETDWLMAIAV